MSIRVLVVEDEPVVRSLAVDVLADAGYETVEAANATQALDVLANSEQRSMSCLLMSGCPDE